MIRAEADLTPAKIVAELDRYVVGQQEAKKDCCKDCCKDMAKHEGHDAEHRPAQ